MELKTCVSRRHSVHAWRLSRGRRPGAFCEELACTRFVRSVGGFRLNSSEMLSLPRKPRRLPRQRRPLLSRLRRSAKRSAGIYRILQLVFSSPGDQGLC